MVGEEVQLIGARRCERSDGCQALPCQVGAIQADDRYRDVRQAVRDHRRRSPLAAGGTLTSASMPYSVYRLAVWSDSSVVPAVRKSIATSAAASPKPSLVAAR